MDPRDLGAKCDECPLRGRKPVCSEKRPNAKVVFIGQSPGAQEEYLGRPFVGSSGDLLEAALDEVPIEGEKIDRSQVTLTNALLCRLPKGWKTGDPKTQTALRACFPRLQRELKGIRSTKTIITLGAEAMQVVTGRKEGLNSWVGGTMEARPELPGWKAHVLLHPAFVLRYMGYWPAFLAHLETGLRLALGRLPRFRWGQLIVDHGPKMKAALEKILIEDDEVATDTETGGKNPFRVPIMCASIAGKKRAVSFHWPPHPDIEPLVRQIFRTKGLIYQNGAHDIPAYRTAGYRLKAMAFDTMLAHAVLAPEMNMKDMGHGLGFMNTIHFPGMPRFKTEHGITKEAKGDERWVKMYENRPRATRVYNGRDSISTRRLAVQLRRELDAMPGGWDLYRQYHKMAEVAVVMRAMGLRLDPTKLAKHRVELTKRREEARTALQAIAKRAGYKREVVRKKKTIDVPFNPGSPKQCAKVVFHHLKERPTVWTPEGAPSLNEEYLVSLLASTRPVVSLFARLLMEYRRWDKLLGTYIDGLPLVCKVIGHVDCVPSPDHTVQAQLKVDGARSGRFSCVDPNLQNQPEGVRELYIPREGYTFVEADYEALELYIITDLSGDRTLTEWRRQGLDVHRRTVAVLNGIRDEDVPKNVRTLWKRVRYAWNYRASAYRIWKTLVADFPETTLEQVEVMCKELDRLHPDIVDFCKRQYEFAKINGYIEAPISGRRKHFYEGRIKPTEVANYPIQMSAADVMNRSFLNIARRLKFKTWERPDVDHRLLLQVHDSLLGESRKPLELAAILVEEMSRPVYISGRRVRYHATAKIGPDWGHMTEVKVAA